MAHIYQTTRGNPTRIGQYLWLCPICGAAHGLRTTRKVKYTPVEQKPYLETIEFDPNKPFGVILETLGRGRGKRLIGYFNPEDRPEDFEQVKQRLLQALREWVVDKRWITREEVDHFLKVD